MYIATDREFQVKGASAYYWVMVWWFVLIFQLTYGKFLVTGIPLASLWTPVLYTNTFSIIPALLVCAVAGELSEARLSTVDVTTTALVWLLLSCAIGIGISWAVRASHRAVPRAVRRPHELTYRHRAAAQGFWCQSLVSATTYTVVGVGVRGSSPSHRVRGARTQLGGVASRQKHSPSTDTDR